MEFRRRSRLAADGSNQNLSISGSLIGKIGSGNQYLPELSQVHRKTAFSGAERQRVFENLVDLYSNGLSLSDIAKQTGKPKTTIRSALVKAGVRIRSSVPAPFSSAIRDSAKTNAAPYFGFCFFQGQVIPDPKEFVNLQLIHELWKSGINPNRIAEKLNAKKIRPRCAQKWNRNSIIKIINRFENKSVILKSGGKYELR